MRQTRTTLDLKTNGPGLVEITRPVAEWVTDQGLREGLLTVFIRHTSASLLIQENADPDVLADLVDAYARLAPTEAPYRHRSEGPDDMPAHIKAALSQTSLSVPLVEGRLALGAWQGLYVFEHRDRPHTRQVMLHLIGD